MLKTLLVDDHPVIRFAVRMLLEKAGIQIVGEADNGAEAIQLVHQIKPNLIILDMAIPKVDGFQVIDHILRHSRLIKILVLTSQATTHFAQRCQNAGANGFITKTEDLTGLVEAVRVVGRGYNYFPQADYLEANCLRPSREDAETIKMISDREMSVLIKLAAGMSNKEISQELFLSEKTISTYKHRLKTKLSAKSIIDLNDFARRNKLID